MVYMFDNIEMAYQMECVGDIPTKRGKMEKIIRLLAETDDPNNLEVQNNIFTSVGLNIEDLTSAEIQYMENEIARRI